jgi:diaminopimelate decarboxylase
VENEPELTRLSRIAAEKGKAQAIAIRVNPDVGAGGHAKIDTGYGDSKFGVSFEEAARLYALAEQHLEGVRPLGVACHIGSQITDLAPMEKAFVKMRGLVETLRAQGRTVERLDLGGGLGVPYHGQAGLPSPADYAAMVLRVTDGLGVRLAFEPGRLIAGNAGVLLSRVVLIHERPGGKRFAVVDAAMNDLIRPTLYDAYHDIKTVAEPDGPPANQAYDVVGPICETGDTFTRDRDLPPLKAGDLVCFMTAGAYGAVMASEYNSRPLIAEVMVRGQDWSVVRRRRTYDDMFADEQKPAWL